MFSHSRACALAGATLAAALACGCHDDHAHPHDRAATAPEPIVESHTVYTALAEHFDEHPRLVAGKPAKFAAHATDIRGESFKPVREGTLAVIALRDGKVIAESVPAQNSRPGIFGPVITIPTAGMVEVRVRLDAPGIGLKDEASLGEITVYASEAEAAKAPEAEADAGAEPIAFLKDQQGPIDFRNEPAAPRRLVETLRVPGRVVARPGGRANVAAPAAGLSLPPGDGGFPKLGDRVEAGAVLGSIAPVLGGAEGTQHLLARAELEVKATEVEADVARAGARLERTGRLRARAERMRKEGAASERELEDARFEEELARGDLAAAEKLREPFAAVRQARAGGGAPLSVALRAPIGGVLIAARATPGEYVEAGRALFEVADLAMVSIEGEIPESDLARLPPAPRAAYVSAAAPTATSQGSGLELVAIVPAIDPETRAARALYAAPNPHGSLRLGAAVDLLIETARAEEALAVPEAAIVEEDGRPVVFVQLEGEAFERRELVTGLRSGGYVQVLSGLEPGERVVSKGAYAVRLQSVSTAIPAHGHAH